ncbi:hypothetical protein ACFSL6_19130 [Paenibacillus thailandensis]|uniref:Uncharacterized protein n=1 Tax=Paenibacillus thailandensis TaxID=393250 RepID=A0ABW5QT35_9BACL
MLTESRCQVQTGTWTESEWAPEQGRGTRSSRMPILLRLFPVTEHQGFHGAQAAAVKAN